MRSRELLTAAVLIGVASCSTTSKPEYLPHQDPVNPNQIVAMLNYGHRGSDIVAHTGDIANGFDPVNGISYGEADKKLILEKNNQWEYGYVNIFVSWDHDQREKYVPFLMDTLEEANASTQVGVIDEVPSARVLTQQEMDSDFAEFKDLSERPNYIKGPNGKGDVLVFDHSFQLINDPDVVRKVANSAEKYGLNVWMQTFPFYDFLPDSGRINWFFDYDPYAFPTGTYTTDTTFTVMYGYHKDWDIKSLDKNYIRITQDLRQGIASGKELLLGVSDGEGKENTFADQTIFQIYHNEVSPKVNSFPVNGLIFNSTTSFY